jgi:hypothetical protein
MEGSGTPVAEVGQMAAGKWHAYYNVFDISLGKPFYISRYLVMNPHFGLRGACIDQHVSYHYDGNAPATTLTHNRGNNDFWGVGIRAGLDSDWIIGKGWCLFGNISASMLSGKFCIHQTLDIPNGDDISPIEEEYYQNTPNVEMSLGIGWGTHFNKKRNHVGLRLAYEFVEWFDQFNMRKFFSGSSGSVGGMATVNDGFANDTVSRGNLTLNGLSFKLQFDI